MENNSPSPSQHDRLVRWLSEEGYPFELRVGRICSQSGWSVSHASLYTDPQTGKERQIDVVASLASSEVWIPEEEEGYRLIVSYVIETKSRRDKPWAVFTSPFTDDSIESRPLYTLTPPGPGLDLLRVAQTSSDVPFRFLKPGKVAHGVVQSYSTDRANPAYSAVQSAANATVALARTFTPPKSYPESIQAAEAETDRLLPEEMDELMEAAYAPRAIEVFFPLVVIGDEFFEAAVDETDTLKVRSIPIAQVVIASPVAGGGPLLATVVQVNALRQHLLDAGNDVERLFKAAEPRLPEIVQRWFR